jgi:uridine phosphorylase
VLLPGDPDRTYRIAQYWNHSEELAFYRQFRTIRGSYKSVPIATTSTGIGTTAGEICLHELATIGVTTCIRVGTTGSISPDLNCGDLIISTAAVRRDGTSDLYVPPEFPAVASPEVVLALIEACQTLGFSYGVGVICSTASLYLGQGRRPSKGGYWPSWAGTTIPDLQTAGVVNFDTDSAGLFVVGHLHGMRVGTITAVIANRVHNTHGDHGGELRACQAANEAVRILAEWDTLKQAAGARYFYPSLLSNTPQIGGSDDAPPAALRPG